MVYMYQSFLIHLSADGHLGCVHVLAVINSPSPLLNYFLVIWHQKMLQSYFHIFLVPVLESSSQPFLQGVLVVFIGEWYFRNQDLGTRCAFCY